MIEPYQLWGIRPTRLAIVKLGGYPSLRRLKTAWVKTLKGGTGRSLEARLYTTTQCYTVINDQMDHVELREFNSSLQRDQRIIDEAEYFTVVAFLGVGQYSRNEVPNITEAHRLGEELARQNKRNYMIYAVNKKGNSAFVGSIIGVKKHASRTIRGHPSL
jgi:hypothetical protein